jgi:hypothetical protein
MFPEEGEVVMEGNHRSYRKHEMKETRRIALISERGNITVTFYC